MGKRGPTSRPTYLKALEGVREDRLNRSEPLPGESLVRPAVGLSVEAQAVWDRLAPDLIEKRVLTAWDVDMFALFCRATVQFRRAADDLESSDDWSGPALRAMRAAADIMRSVGQRFGLTPGDRAALKVDHYVRTKTGAERLLT